MMGLAAVIGMLLTTTGLALSYGPDLPTGSTIILVAGSAYLLSTAAGALAGRLLVRRRTRAVGPRR